MSGVGDGPELFGGGFGIIKAIDHFCGDVCVFFAMDEEDGLLAFGDLLQWAYKRLFIDLANETENRLPKSGKKRMSYTDIGRHI